MKDAMHELIRLSRITIISVMPFLILNTIVSQQLQPMLSWLRPSGHTSGLELVAFGTSVIWCGVCALYLIWPIRPTSSWAIMRTSVGVVLLSLVVLLMLTVGDELYRCDVIAQINCD